MSDRSRIEWTDATWNPVTGCTKVSPGCDHCYAETLAERFRGTPGHYYERGFDVQLRPDKLDQPLRWRRPRRVFVNSMSDLFHDQVPDEFIARVFAVMALSPQHTFQVLTKRHGRMRSLLSSAWFRVWVLDAAYLMAVGEDAAAVPPRPVGTAHRDRVTVTLALARVPGVDAGSAWPWPLPNVWLGVSVEDQRWADIRVPALINTPAAVRFLSCEPLLGPVRLWDNETCDHKRQTCEEIGCWRAIDWVIAGGESGRNARPMHPDWVRSLRDQCQAAGVAFHFKQWGEWAPAGHGARVGLNPSCSLNLHDSKPAEHWFPTPAPDDPRLTHTVVRRIGKPAAGRLLDGRTWDEYPVVAS